MASPEPRIGPLRSALLAGIPLGVQLVATVAAATLLRPPSGVNRAFYAPTFGITVLAGYAALVVATIAVARRLGPPDAVLALRAVPPRRAIGPVIAVLVLAVTASLALEPIFHGVADQGLAPGPPPPGTTAAAGLVLTTMALVAAAPIAEELYFRGLLYHVLAPLGPAVAVIGTGVAFGAAHLQPSGFPVLAIYGVLVGWLRHRLGSSVPGVVAHALNNAAAVAVAVTLT